MRRNPEAPRQPAEARQDRRQVRLLALLALTLAALAVWQVASEAEEDPLLGIAMPVRPPQAAEGAPAPPGIADTDAMMERPLFSETRRRFVPIPPARAAAPPPAPPPPPLAAAHKLIGLSVADGQVVALVQSGTGRAAKVRRLRQGEALAGWTLVGSEARSVVFRRGEDGPSQRLDLPSAAPAEGRPGRRPPPARRPAAQDDDDDDED